VSEARYKAFISYSHRDERWARWLQRALEGYRVPRRLVGHAAEHGPVPARLRPVFRDREDLSSASDLSGRIRQELDASETLIVICSPAAAESRWVNEEVRYFRELGRTDRILALVVDGAPDGGGPGCFPPALVESADGERREPLAADARRYADGKHLALLKIVAGILGVRLDELRRRDAQRRLRRRAVNTLAAVSLAVVIAWLFHAAQSSSESARMQRANTEEYLAFMLGNLDRLAPIPGLEAVSAHDREMERLGEQLGLGDLANETLLERARRWRETGLDLMWESDLDAAMRELENSRAALIELHLRDRQSPVALFELGQAEYYVGEVHVRQGAIEEAQWHWYRYGVLTRRLVNADPYNPLYVMELAYTLNNIGAVEQQKLMPDFASSLEHINQAVQFNRIALGLEPDNQEFQRQLITMLEWKADAHMGLCELGEALEFRQETVTRRREFTRRNREDPDDLEQLALTLGGLAGVQQGIGLNEAAAASFSEAVEIFRGLSETQPENVRIAWEALYREVRLARLIAASGDRARAAEIVLGHADRARELATASSRADKYITIEAALFEIDHARILFSRQDAAGGEERLRHAVAQLAELVTERPEFRPGLDALVDAYFEYWAHLGASPGPGVDRLVTRFPVTPENLQSCYDAHLAASLAVMRGDAGAAGAYVDYALEKGYYAPEFIEFCQRYGLCEAP
jgi:tetratricopeptide (TPR) repeat protein